MTVEAADFLSLKRWIKDFKTQHSRDPFCEDFPADIGKASRALPALPIYIDSLPFVQRQNGSSGKHTSSNRLLQV